MDCSDRLIALRQRLPDLMQVDTAWCASKLASAARRLSSGKPVDALLDGMAARMEASAARSQQRLKQRPVPEFDPALPITAHRDEIVAAIKEHPVVIVAGETGSGKTTQLPKLCLAAGRGSRGLIGCTQPRRIAARAMAERVSEELGSPLGQVVGYQVRFRDQRSPDNLIKFMTDGILLAETLGDRHLDAYDTLIIDEAHERSLNIDFLLGYLKTLRKNRPDLRVIITSATIDTEKFARHFEQAPVIEVSGRGYPVELIYQPLGEPDAELDTSKRRDMYRGIAEAVDRLSRIDRHGDILVFLSGEREIREATDFLKRRGLAHTEVLPLYARLSSADQRRVFHPGPQRRIILSTNVAETSLTVPRIRFVVDSGLVRMSRYAHRSRIQRLPIEPVSQASANQRSGRCGRLGPGTCIRLYSEQDFDLRPAFTEPEILRTSLASVILRMLSMGLGEIEDFPFLDKPAPRMINDAQHLLFELGAVDAQRQVTPSGRQLARWPLDVRLARMVMEGAAMNCATDLIVLVAGLSIQDPRERPLDAREAADESHQRFAEPLSDFVAMLKIWAYLRKQRKALTGSAFRKMCKREFFNAQRVLEWFDLVQQLRDQAREQKLALHSRTVAGDASKTADAGDAAFEALHKAILSGLLSQVGQKDPERPEYLGARNRRFRIFPGSFLFGRSPKWLVSAEIVETEQTWARMNAQIQPAWLELQGRHLLKPRYFDPHWSDNRQQVMANLQLSLFGLVVVERRKVAYGVVDRLESQRIFIDQALLQGRLRDEPNFLTRNQALMNQWREMEHKRRRHDVLADEAQLAAFYATRLPPDVNSARSLNRWLKKDPDGHAQSLMMADADLLRDPDQALTPADYPDELCWHGQCFALRYRFAPGEDDDGVTLEVPLEHLNRLDSGQLQWLVPGLLVDKVASWLRCLPKPVRRGLPSGPAWLDTLMTRLAPQRDAPLAVALARALSKAQADQAKQVKVAASLFVETDLADYLRVRIEVQDDTGQVLASGRDVETLQERLGQQARRRFMDRQGQQWNRDGETRWAFDTLPESVTTQAGTPAWPALVDQGGAVGLRLFDSADDALHAHVDGVLALLRLELKDKLSYLRKQHNMDQSALLAWSAHGSSAELLADLASNSLLAVSADQLAGTRSEGQFAALAASARAAIGAEFMKRAALLQQALTSLAAIQARLAHEVADTYPAVHEDIQSQLDDLLYAGFLRDIEANRLQHYPRYLSAIELRLVRLAEDPQRDARMAAQCQPYWQKYLSHIGAGAVYDEALDQYRWLLEEFRVSLFAQQLGTAEKVSPARLDKAWRKTGGHG